MIGTMYFLRANCAQHGGSASGGGLISASLLKLQGSIQNVEREKEFKRSKRDEYTKREGEERRGKGEKVEVI